MHVKIVMRRFVRGLIALPRPLRLTLAAGMAGAWLLTTAATVFVLWPLPVDVASPSPVPSVELLDRHGLPLRTTRADDGSRGGWVPLDRIDPEIIQAFVATEDRRFFEHHGIDIRAAIRAARDNITHGRVVSGASTLTMQTARLVRPLNRGWSGKALQALWALRLEARMSKGHILETYLNRVPLGQGAVGVAAAARLYFDAPASNVSPGQAALLAGIARLPARSNPIASAERAAARRDAVIESMLALGFITPGDADRATREPVLARTASARFLAPHFTTQLLHRIGEDATGKYRTTLDLELQHAIEAEVRHTVETLREREARHAAAVVLDNRTGAILAWVGSPDFFADTAGQVDMVASRRQPGSALKPFLYGHAFDRGFTPASILPDVPRTYATTTGPYRPQNYDRRFRGPVRARVALASSFNVPAVELTSRLGATALLETLRDAGFASLDRSADHYGLGLALGNGEVTLLELANAYRGLAAGGLTRPVRWLDDEPQRTGIHPMARSTTGRPAWSDDPGHRFMSAGAAVLVLDILQDPVARIPGFGAETPFDFPFPAAAKTGTSRHFTDNWAVATTANFTVAVWVGNFNGRPMQGVSGVTGAGPLLYRSVLQTARRYPPGLLPTPDIAGAEPATVCALSGMRATRDCPSLVEWFMPGTSPGAADTWQTGGHTTLPPEYSDWLAMESSEELEASIATTMDDASTPRILSPLDGDVYEIPPGVAPRFATIPLTASTTGRVTWRIDGIRFEGARWMPEKGSHLVEAEWSSGTRDSVHIVVR